MELTESYLSRANTPLKKVKAFMRSLGYTPTKSFLSPFTVRTLTRKVYRDSVFPEKYTDSTNPDVQVDMWWYHTSHGVPLEWP